MAIINCPNKSLPEFKALIAEFGEGSAVALWRNNDEVTPTIDEARKLLEPVSVKPADTKLNKRISGFVKSMGGKITQVDSIVIDGVQVAANAVSNTITRTISMVNGKGSIDTLPEEAAHLYVEWLPANSVLLRDMMKDITNWKEYSDVLREYGDNEFYKNADGSINYEKIKKEAIGKVVAKALVDKWDNKKAQSWLQRILDWVKKVFAGVEYKTTYEQVAAEILNADVSNLDMAAIKEADARGEYYFQLTPVERAIAETQMKSGTKVQQEIIKELYLNVHDRVKLDKATHIYSDLKTKTPLIYKSVTTAIHGKKNIVGYDDNRDWGNDFDALLQGVILGLKPEEIELTGKTDKVKNEAYYQLKGMVSAWTADGSIALPQVIVANKNEGIPGAEPIAGSIDVLLIDPYGEMTVVDLKTSWNSIYGSDYFNKSYNTGADSLLPNTSLSKGQGHSVQVMTYAKLIEIMGFPVKAVRTEHFKLNHSGSDVTSFEYEKTIPRVLSENRDLVDKIVPTPVSGKNRLNELNEEFQTGNPTHREEFGATDGQTAEQTASTAQALDEMVTQIGVAAKGWEEYLKELRHQSVYDVNDNSIRKIDDFINQMRALWAQGKKLDVYPLFLNTVNKHIDSILKVLSDPANIQKPGYVRSAYMAKKYIDTFRPFLSSSFATMTNSRNVFDKIDMNIKAADTAILGAIRNTVKNLVQQYSSNKKFDNDENLEAILQMDKDISGSNTWFDTLGNSDVVILENAAKMLADARETVRENTNSIISRIQAFGNKLIAAVGSKDPQKLYEVFYQKDSNGKRNGRLVSQRGSKYMEMAEKVRFPLYNLDGTAKEYIRRPKTPEQLEFNKSLTRLKNAQRKFMEAEHVEVEMTADGPDTTVTEGDYHRYTDAFLEGREKYMKEDDFGRWKAISESNPEYVKWRNENFEWVQYLKPEMVFDENTGKREPTGRVSEASEWFPKSHNIVSREYAADGTDLWDPGYRKLMNPQTELEKVQSEFYKGYIEILREQVEKLPPSAMYWFQQGYIPTLQGNFIDEMSQTGVSTASVITKQLRTFFDVTAMSNQSDVNKTGSGMQSLPIMFMGSLQNQQRLSAIETQITEWATHKEKMSAAGKTKQWHEKNDVLLDLRKKELHKITASQIHPDLVQGLSAFAAMAENFNIMSEVEDTLIAVGDQIKTMQFTGKGGKEVKGTESNALKRLNKFMDMVFYNDPTFTKTTAEVVINRFQKLTSGISIPFNLFGMVNNKIMARINNRIDAIGSSLFGHGAYNRTWGRYNSEFIPGVVKTIGTHIGDKNYGERKAGSLYEWLTRVYNMVRHAHVDQSKVQFLSWGYKGYEAAEYEAQSLVGNAVLDSIQMKYTGTNPELSDCSVYDAYTWDANTGEGKLIDGYVFLDKNGNVAEDQKRAKHLVTNRIHETNDRIHGNYDPANKIMAESTVAGKLAIQFHKWVWPNFKSRFQPNKFDENLGGGIEIEGRYVTLWSVIKDIYKYQELTGRWDELTEFQKSNVKKTGTDLMYFAAFFLVAHLMKSLAAGVPDDDPMLKKCVNWMRYQSSRGMQEVGLFIPAIGFVESYQLLQNPFAATNALAQFAQLLSSAVEWPFLTEEDARFQRGNFKGELKVYKEARDVMPILREVNRMTNLNTVTTFYVN